ncbi:hypothetical protein ES692_04255 [Psychroserpens burtonensis]|uniref:Beta-carotene 15,15'-monooxygenase n=1 Tax=Psychroserpens burtonensis TaxID=49278 RepID=A0A5C7BB65_9FLAO|nr:DUF6427 family protein [Psychroserpens burtonensis]TXE19075.1 hypothetical protein ES692_04255 [Psychroserpens burtonensis]
MISNFFSKSKPIQYIVVSVILLLIFILSRLNVFSENSNVIVFAEQIGLLLITLLSVFVFDFLVTRNGLTKKNSYSIILFVVFFAILPQTLLHTRLLVANFFILLALRRLVSLRSQKEIKKKLFDASIWIAVATLFYFWSSVFFIMIISALLLYVITDVKNYLIPFVGVATVAVIVVSYLVVFDKDIIDYTVGIFDFSLDFSALNSKRLIVGSTLLFSVGLWSLFYYIKNINSQMKNNKPSFKLIILSLILGLFIVVVAPSKNGSEFIFLFAPLAIIITNYVEVIPEKWFKETLLWVMILTPIVLLML